MKLVIAVIKNFKIEEVTEALQELDVPGVTLTEARGYGRQRGHTEVYRGAEYKIDYLPKLRLELLIEDADVERVTTAIVGSARTGKIGDGKVWVMPIDSVIRIRTGERGADAL